MIDANDIQRLMHREGDGKPVLSIFLDTRVNSENKRTYHVFLNQERARFAELASDRNRHHREALGEALARVERWLADAYQEVNKGVGLYTEIGGPWFQAYQFPVPVSNRLVIGPRPVIGPLVQVVEGAHHHGVVLVDREHLRLFSAYLGRPLHEHEVRTEPYPAPHDVQRGGYSQKGYQQRKAEEVRHFFKDFAQEVREFHRRYRPDDLVILGTDANVKQFVEFLPRTLQDCIVHTGHPPEAGVDSTVADVLAALEPTFTRLARQRDQEALDRLRDRARHEHMAVAGFPNTLEHLQEGKAASLVIARNIERPGAQCERCRFVLAGNDAACPYCGGRLRNNVDVVEAILWMAQEQELPVHFVEPGDMTDLHGVGVLLRF